MTSPGASERLRGLRILLGVTGGIAAYKAAYLVRLLRTAGAEVVVAMTPSAGRFIGPLTLATLSGHPVITSIWEPVGPRLPGDVTHVGLGKWAHLAVVAPLTMNSLGKLALGLADDPVSTFFAAFEPRRTLLAPAMNAAMWRSAATRANLDALRERGCRVVGPGSGELACGDVDEGRLAEPEEILAALAEMAAAPAGRLSGRRVLVTAGPTRERLDPVRFLTSGSTGTMGLALAEAAWLEGAWVTLVAGPGVAPAAAPIERVDVESAAEMAAAVLARAEGVDLTFMAAAVADWTPAAPAVAKLKKNGAGRSLELAATTDILAELAARDLGGFRVGFCLETGDLETRAREKLERKRLAMIVANRLGEGSGFGTTTNEVTVLAPGGFVRAFPRQDKTALGRELVALAAERACGE
jgi:phosphopantothenoylcysteine decarboxylase/phosphopantothenate--cysteine ligase